MAVRKILILDDMDCRHTGFTQAHEGLPEVELVHAYTYYEFIELLESTERFDFIWLDYDLGETFNGEDAAELIAKLPPGRKPRVVWVHSANWAGSRRIVEIIHSAGILSTHFDFSSILRGYLPYNLKEREQ